MDARHRGFAANAMLITLPEGFAATRVPGYFWHCKYRELYSIKTGQLRLIKYHKASKYRTYDGYQVSHLGRRRALYMEDLLRLTPQPHIIPYATA